MFLIFGISNGEKKLDFIQTMLCSKCGQYGRFEVYVTFMYFNLFFIPIFHWSRHYYVKSSCCNATYEIDSELGKRIQKGENVILTEYDLHLVNQTGYNFRKNCKDCGYPISSDFEFCPKCGKKL